jgi:hypothetical protein
MTDPIVPNHYHNGTKVDEFIEEFKLGFRLGNTVKYIARHREKGTPLQDLKKAQWYLNREIERMEKQLLDQAMGETPNAR